MNGDDKKMTVPFDSISQRFAKIVKEENKQYVLIGDKKSLSLCA